MIRLGALRTKLTNRPLRHAMLTYDDMTELRVEFIREQQPALAHLIDLAMHGDQDALHAIDGAVASVYTRRASVAA